MFKAFPYLQFQVCSHPSYNNMSCFLSSLSLCFGLIAKSILKFLCDLPFFLKKKFFFAICRIFTLTVNMAYLVSFLKNLLRFGA